MKSVRHVEKLQRRKILLARELILLFVYLLRKGTALAGLCWGWTGGDLIEIEIRYHDAHAARILAAMRGCESGLVFDWRITWRESAPFCLAIGESVGKNGVILSDFGERVWLVIRM
jgi:hypothetical protein